MSKQAKKQPAPKVEDPGDYVPPPPLPPLPRLLKSVRFFTPIEELGMTYHANAQAGHTLELVDDGKFLRVTAPGQRGFGGVKDADRYLCTVNMRYVVSFTE
jgi:hypothetical protein